MANKKLSFIFGTRPEIIKLSPVIKLCQMKRIPFFCIHTGQHYSYDMDQIFLRELGLPRPEYKLNIKSKAPYRQGDHTGRMLIEIEKILLKEMPETIVVQGDTNTVLAGALTAGKISTTENYTGFHIKVAHVEAGLRSFDRTMPEETNRFIVDHLSDFLFVPTESGRKILLKEGVPEQRIYVTGNTIVDAVKLISRNIRQKNNLLGRLGLRRKGFILLTLHRQENVDAKETLGDILNGIQMASSRLSMPVIFPVHPRTAKMLEKFGFQLPQCIKPIKPAGYIDFICLEANAGLILTDSGGVQEESCILTVPCVTLRNNTERPETVKAGANIIAGTRPGSILNSALRMIKRKRNWNIPFGNGRASEKILNVLTRHF